MSGIKRNFIYNALLTTANYVFPLITYPYVTRVLGVENIGICNYVDSIVDYFILFSMLGMTTVGMREIAAAGNDKAKRSNVFSSLFTLNFISTVIAIIALIVCINVVDKFSEYKDLLYIGVLKLFFYLCLIEWLYKGLENFRYITIRSIIVRAIYTVAVFIFIRNKNDYNIYFLLTTLTIVINGIINLLYSRHFVTYSIKNITLKRYIKPFLVFGVYFLITSMYTTFNTFYLGYVTNSTEVGYYATSQKMYTIIIALYTAFTGVMMPRMTSLLSEGNELAFKSYIKKSEEALINFAVPLILASLIFSPEIIRLLAGVGYEGAITPMRIVLPLVLIIGYEQVLIVQALTPMKKDKIILRNSIFGAIVGITLNFLIVKKMAAIGSAIVWLCSEIAVMISAQIYLSKNNGFNFPLKALITHICAYLPEVAILILIATFISSFWLKLILAALVFCAYFVVIQRHLLKNEYVIAALDKIKHSILKGLPIKTD